MAKCNQLTSLPFKGLIHNFSVTLPTDKPTHKQTEIKTEPPWQKSRLGENIIVDRTRLRLLDSSLHDRAVVIKNAQSLTF